MERLKLVALVTIEVSNTENATCFLPEDNFDLLYVCYVQVHARDIIEKLLKAHCESRNAFEWQQQLRFYWVRSMYSVPLLQVCK